MQQTNFNEIAINAKKEDIVKIENHCTKKIRMGYLFCITFVFQKQTVKYVCFWLDQLLEMLKCWDDICLKICPGSGTIVVDDK